MTCAEQRTIFGSTSCNKISRFLEEIPEELVEKQGVGETKSKEREWTYGGNTTTATTYVSKISTSKVTPAYQFRTAESFLNTIAAKPVTSDLSQYKVGQTIFHKKFGEGVITDIAPEEDDLKLDISFEKVGHKRLMAKFANLEIKD